MRLLHKNSKYKWTLEDENFRMWLENVERGSLITAHEMYRRIGYICTAFDTTPAKLAKMKNRDATAFALFLCRNWTRRPYKLSCIGSRVCIEQACSRADKHQGRG